jgi:benzylsuccinate CoA-transferase BbsF subunit
MDESTDRVKRRAAGGALAGLRIVELGDGVAAPFCARLFADYGADVLKIERPGVGDVSRHWGPFPNDEPDLEKSGSFFFLNTGKRSVPLDLESDADRERLRGLLREADLFVESQRPSQMRAWDLDPSAIGGLNPDLVTISITPFGQTGPYADWLGYDLNAYHLTACGSRYCGRPDAPPLEQGTFSTEFFAGFAGMAWGLSAVLGRERVGGGQHLDVSSAEVVAALFVGAQNIGPYAQEGRYEKRSGQGMGLGAPATILPCADGYVWMIALEKGQWRGLREAMGDPEWARVELFDDLFERGRNADILYPLLEEWTLQHSKQHIMDVCQAHGCPATAVFTTEDLASHPHLLERGAITEMEHPRLGRVQTPGVPIRLTEGLPTHRAAPPLLGEHHDALDANGSRSTGPWLRERPTGPPDRTIMGAAPDAPPSRGRGKHLPLAGLRVANFGWAWAGPAAGQVLGILGAEVYKIETRARIDINRTLPPFAEGIADPNRSLQNHAGWAGNGSVQLNLKKPEARDLARQLVAVSDVAIENFGPGVLEKLDLGYARLVESKPDLILVSMPGAGLTGPLRHLRTYGNSLGGIAGIDQLTGYCDDAPMPMENGFADPYCGLAAACSALIALEHRRQTGHGQHIDCSQQEALMQMIGPQLMDQILNGRVAGRIGNRHPLGAAAPHGVFPCRGEDRWISIAVYTDDEWRGLVRAMDGPAWTQSFGSLDARLAGIDALHAQLARWTEGFRDRELAARLQDHGVAAAPVLDVADLLHDPHYKARETFIEVTHPLGFRETIYGSYVKTSRTVADMRPGPAIGQDNDAVFKDLLGLSERRYRQLIADEVIY